MATDPGSGTIRAAGAVLWRPAPDGARKDGPSIALVHRPRYDDWSLPKGKAIAGEHPPGTAAREVLEETGFTAAIGRSLTTVSYEAAGRPKTVLYFSARAGGGTFRPNREVDQLDWLPVRAAGARMTYEYDRAVLTTFALETPELTGVVLVRHAKAGHRESYEGNDDERPLDGKGRRQAQALATELAVFGPRAVHSVPIERCRATVEPLATSLGLEVQPEPLLAEDAYRDDPAAARRRLLELAEAHAGEALVVCSQGGVIPGVVKSLAGRAGVPIAAVSTPKAAYWYLSFEDRALLQADHYPAPPAA